MAGAVVCGRDVELWAGVVVLPFDGAIGEGRWSYKDAVDPRFR
jgi:hypothetical protein